MIIDSLFASYGQNVSALQGARFIQTNKNKIITVVQHNSTDFSATAHLLQKITTKQSLVFWFSDNDNHNRPHLILADDNKRLKALVMEKGETGNVIRGQIKLSSKGWIEFRVKDTYPNFIEKIASFVIANHQNWPIFKELRGARMIQKQGEKILDRQKNDKIWSALPID